MYLHRRANSHDLFLNNFSCSRGNSFYVHWVVWKDSFVLKLLLLLLFFFCNFGIEEKEVYICGY